MERRPIVPTDPAVAKILRKIWIKKHGNDGNDQHILLQHNYRNIVKEADSKVYPHYKMAGSLDIEKMYGYYDNLVNDMLKGIYLDKKTKLFWVDEKTGDNCVKLFPRTLTIPWGNDNRFWQWHFMEDH